MIEINNLCKRLQNKDVLKDISLKVNEGSIFGLIGPNGAGKTTLIKTLAGIYMPDSGEVKINGENVFQNSNIKQIMGYVADENNFYNNFTIKYLKKLFGLTYRNFDTDYFDSLNDIYKLPLNATVKKFSKGMKMRLSIMLNMSITPRVLILDEPTSGLDPIARRQFLDLLVDNVAQRNTTVFISSHDLNHLERICDSIAIINTGEIKYVNSIDDMKRNIRKIQVVFNNSAPDDLEKWQDIIKVEKVGRVYTIVTGNYSEALKLKLQKADIAFQEEIDLSLEDMFIYSIGGDSGYEKTFK
jgi:ABC-2 type transport system ATP-binding protein